MGLFDALTGVKKPKAGTPVKPEAELRAALLALNRDTAPWAIRAATAEEKCDLVDEWRIVDAKWYEIFAKAGLKSVFKIFLKFDAAKNEVRAVDQEWTVEWRAGVPALSLSALGDEDAAAGGDQRRRLDLARRGVRKALAAARAAS